MYKEIRVYLLLLHSPGNHLLIDIEWIYRFYVCTWTNQVKPQKCSCLKSPVALPQAKSSIWWDGRVSVDMIGLVDVDLLGCNAVWTCRWITFRSNILPLSLQPWRWRQCVAPKRWYLPTSPHGVTTHKTGHFHRRDDLKSHVTGLLVADFAFTSHLKQRFHLHNRPSCWISKYVSSFCSYSFSSDFPFSLNPAPHLPR
jgi:hypothetical protein